MCQHDATIVQHHAISIFRNNVFRQEVHGKINRIVDFGPRLIGGLSSLDIGAYGHRKINLCERYSMLQSALAEVNS